jgi:hypothetical protein
MQEKIASFQSILLGGSRSIFRGSDCEEEYWGENASLCILRFSANTSIHLTLTVLYIIYRSDFFNTSFQTLDFVSVFKRNLVKSGDRDYLSRLGPPK